MVNAISWQHPFNEAFGEGIVFRLFETAGIAYAVGFEHIKTMHELLTKGVDIYHACPDFLFPANGVWTVIFDRIDPLTQQLYGYQHVEHTGVMGGRVLFNVASIIFDHYTVSCAAAYVFSAANDCENQRKTDLTELYSALLGLDGHPRSRLFQRFDGWCAWSDTAIGGRGYVVTTKSYKSL